MNEKEIHIGTRHRRARQLRISNYELRSSRTRFSSSPPLWGGFRWGLFSSSTAQFMQPDNYIQTPEDYIGYNRYAYCRYNPFKHTDPSGEVVTYMLDINPNDHGFFAYNPATTSLNAMENVYEYMTIKYLTDPITKKTKKSTSYGKGTKQEIENKKAQTKGGGGVNIFNLLINSVLVGVDANLSFSVGAIVAGNGVPCGGIFILRGQDAFETFGYSSGGGGYGAIVGASAMITSMTYYYYGDINNFNHNTFSGWSTSVDVGGGELGQAGLSVSWLQDKYGGYLIGVGYGGGIGVSAFLFSGTINFQNTTLWGGKK